MCVGRGIYSMNDQKGGRYGTRNSLAVIVLFGSQLPATETATETIKSFGETTMQTDIEILESRENPIILWC